MCVLVANPSFLTGINFYVGNPMYIQRACSISKSTARSIRPELTQAIHRQDRMAFEPSLSPLTITIVT